MPHVIIKLYPGRSEAQKQQLADAITRNVVAIAGCAEKSVSVAIEEVAPDEWTARVYKPDIEAHADKLYRKPGYDPFQ
ncbi:MAG: tautomerase family protein [Desulfosarcina sp.]|nr:tautomerase family protein [Desulfobacterales bacterium]